MYKELLGRSHYNVVNTRYCCCCYTVPKYNVKRIGLVEEDCRVLRAASQRLSDEIIDRVIVMENSTCPVSAPIVRTSHEPINESRRDVDECNCCSLNARRALA